MKYIIVLFCYSIFCMNRQTVGSNDFLIKVDKIKLLMTEANEALPEITYSLDYNERITNGLSEILKDERSVSYNLDQLLKHDFLGITHSNDKRLWFFSWAENANGTFKGGPTIIQYRTKANKPKIILDEFNDTESSRFNSNGAGYPDIIKLKSNKDVYLCLGDILGCSTCCSRIALVIELKNDSINFDYPAFPKTYRYDSKASLLMLHSRCGDIIKFEYDPISQSISYDYYPDDLTPIEDKNFKKSFIIKQVLYWDSEAFVEEN